MDTPQFCHVVPFCHLVITAYNLICVLYHGYILLTLSLQPPTQITILQAEGSCEMNTVVNPNVDFFVTY